jgi:hypothetical protein
MDGLLWETRQSGRIAGARIAAGTAQSAANTAKADVREMGRRIDKLTMIVEGLWVFLQREHGYTEAQLVEMVTEIDLRDGLLDGRVKRQPRDCEECGKVIGADKAVCMWCGAEDQDLFGNKARAQRGDDDDDDDGDNRSRGPRGLAP